MLLTLGAPLATGLGLYNVAEGIAYLRRSPVSDARGKPIFYKAKRGFGQSGYLNRPWKFDIWPPSPIRVDPINSPAQLEQMLQEQNGETPTDSYIFINGVELQDFSPTETRSEVVTTFGDDSFVRAETRNEDLRAKLVNELSNKPQGFPLYLMGRPTRNIVDLDDLPLEGEYPIRLIDIGPALRK